MSRSSFDSAAADQTVCDVEFVVLGSGTSSGVPVIGCDCAVCLSDDPRDQRLRCSSCIRFTDASGQERLILLDTSPDLRDQALRYGLLRCDAILYTHNHVDHTFGLDEVRRFNVLMDASIEVYAEERTMEFLHRVYQHIFRREHNVNKSFVATLIPRLIDPAKPIDLFGLRFTPVRVLHGRLPVLGYRIEATDRNGAIAAVQPGPLPLAYCTDVSAIPPESWPKLRGLETFLLDMLRYRHHPTHFTVDEAITTADRVGATRTWFVHMTHDIQHAELDPRLPEGMSLAHDGLIIS
jgi:phosphoribosyl 1,2-cyclic phosphate phosphodiesterase